MTTHPTATGYRYDLNWSSGWMAHNESVAAWLDRVHPVQYGISGNSRYWWGEPLKRAGTRDEIGLPIERYNRCPTCEEWSPCTVRKRVGALLA